MLNKKDKLYHNYSKFNQNLILDALKNNQVFSYFQLVRKLNIARSLNRDFSFFLKDLVNKSIIFKTNDDNYYLPKKLKIIQGIIKVTAKGFAFIDIDKENSVFIASIHKNNAFNGDEVEINLYQDGENKAKEFGVVTKILKRNTEKIVGLTMKNGIYVDFIPVDPSFKNRYKIINLNEKAHTHKYVEVKVKEFQNNRILIEIIKVIGSVDSLKAQIDMFIKNQGVSSDFPLAVVAAASLIPQTIEKEDLSKRKDFRNHLIITIDGDDTKDFDDAIEVYKNEKDNFVLGVHIADVSHYVKNEQAIDHEALLRGTSIYLVDRVIPMLPESLSNGICSLNPHVDRLSMSIEIEIDQTGKTISTKLNEGIINSKYRLTYQQVNNFYQKKTKFDDPKLNEMLNLAYDLSLIIREHKKNEGYIDFEIEESKIILDDNFKTIDIVVRERHESEILIEDFMVCANESIAKLLAKKKIPSLYRIHDVPTVESIITLQNVLKSLNIPVHIKESSDPRDFAKAVSEIKKHRFDDFLKIMMLRTMQKAVYSKDNIGHFGLASSFYTHFTSPIRRYPDLIVHRILREIIMHNNFSYKEELASKLASIADSTSKREVDAVILERKVADVKKAEFFKTKIGETHSGQIVSIQKFGFFVEFNNKIDVLVNIHNMPGRDWKKDEKSLFISNGKETFKVGDQINVVIIGASPLEGKIDAVVASHYEQFTKFQKPQRGRANGKSNSKK